MKLPIKQILSKNRKLYQIVDAEGTLLIKDINDLSFALDICDKFNNCNMINKTEKALNLLSDEGYYVKNLWGVDDVMIGWECTKEQALEILDKTFDNEYVNETIFDIIGINAREMNLTSKENY